MAEKEVQDLREGQTEKRNVEHCMADLKSTVYL